MSEIQKVDGYSVGSTKTIRWSTPEEKEVEIRLIKEAKAFSENHNEKMNLEGYYKRKLAGPPVL